MSTGLLLLLAAADARPRPAPPAFVTPEKGLTFRVPPRATHCPLPADWVGSDHGTTLFLVPPRRCAGAIGYPSSDRGFSPAETPRIEVFYGYRLEGSPPPRCRAVGRARLFGRGVSLCAGRQGGLRTISARGRYTADGPVDIVFTLATPSARATRDTATFRALLASARPCSSQWSSQDARRRTSHAFTIGTGKPCPADAAYF